MNTELIKTGLGLIGLGIGAIIGTGAFAYSKFKKQSETSSSESAGQITYDDSDGLYEPSDYDDLLDFKGRVDRCICLALEATQCICLLDLFLQKIPQLE